MKSITRFGQSINRPLGINSVSAPVTPEDVGATSIKPHALMTNAEADFLLSCMPEDALSFIKAAPNERIQGEPVDAFLIRRKFQRRINFIAPEVE